MIRNEEKKRITLFCSKTSVYVIKRNNIKIIIVVFTACSVFIPLEQKINLDVMKKYVKVNVFVEL